MGLCTLCAFIFVCLYFPSDSPKIRKFACFLCHFRFSSGRLFCIISGLCECVGLCTLCAFLLCLIKEKQWAESCLFFGLYIFSFRHSKNPKIHKVLRLTSGLGVDGFGIISGLCECGVVYFVYFSTLSIKEKQWAESSLFRPVFFLQNSKNTKGRRFFVSLPV